MKLKCYNVELMTERTLGKGNEKIPPGQALLLAEPIFKADNQYPEAGSFRVPLGAQSWVERVVSDKRPPEEVLAEEYLAIARGLKDLGVDFRIIIAHREMIDQAGFVAIATSLGVRGLGLDPSISSTTFPRDMMVDFAGKIYINPEANFELKWGGGTRSPLGEGGRVLKLNKKVLVPSSISFLARDPRYKQHITQLSKAGFTFGFLPWPLAVDIDPGQETHEIDVSDHLDRAAAFIRGKDGRDYLLLDSNYANGESPSSGPYLPRIEDACTRLDIVPAIVDRTEESIPYALNLEQFADGSVLMTGGDDGLRGIVERIVGVDKVQTTKTPIVFYPILRNGGIRCMMLLAPGKIVGQPLR